MKKKNKQTIYQEITEKIVQKLRDGVLPWRRPYSLSAMIDRNAASGRPYRGINLILLAMSAMLHGFSSPYWLTFKEAHKLGGHVKKGEKATRIIFWKMIEVEEKDEEGNPLIDPKTGEPITTTIPFGLRYSVFNLEQTEGVTLPSRLRTESFQADGLCERLFNLPVVKWGKIPAYRDDDIIELPPQSAFESTDAFWHSFFHELIHWTAAPGRLKRDLSGRFGDAAYAFEELIAEIGSSFLCAHAGVDPDVDRSATYIDSWIRVLERDSKAIFTAARKAQEACDWLLERARHCLKKAA